MSGHACRTPALAVLTAVGCWTRLACWSCSLVSFVMSNIHCIGMHDRCQEIGQSVDLCYVYPQLLLQTPKEIEHYAAELLPCAPVCIHLSAHRLACLPQRKAQARIKVVALQQAATEHCWLQQCQCTMTCTASYWQLPLPLLPPCCSCARLVIKSATRHSMSTSVPLERQAASSTAPRCITSSM
jgi:hypothetical protein